MPSLWESVTTAALGSLPLAYQYLKGGEQPIDLGLRPPGDLLDLPPVIIGKGGGARASIAEALRLEEAAKLAAGAAEAAAEAARGTTEVVDFWVSQLGETAQAVRAAAPEAAKRAVLGPLLLLKDDPLAPIIPEWDPLGAIPIWVPLLAGAFILAR